MTCHNCNGQAFTPGTVEIVTRIGEYKVIDKYVRRPMCDNCGEYTLPGRTLEKVELRAAVAALVGVKKVTGDIIRFARKALGMTQVEFAEALGTSPESISHWERDECSIERSFPITVRGFLLERLNPLSLVDALPEQARHYYDISKHLSGADRLRALTSAEQHLESHRPEYLGQLKMLQRIRVLPTLTYSG